MKRYVTKSLSDDSHFILVEQKEDKLWQPQYRFTLQGYDFPNYAELLQKQFSIVL